MGSLRLSWYDGVAFALHTHFRVPSSPLTNAECLCKQPLLDTIFHSSPLPGLRSDSDMYTFGFSCKPTPTLQIHARKYHFSQAIKMDFFEL